MESSTQVFLGVLLHETAHLGAMLCLGVFPTRISVSGLGCHICLPREKNLSYLQNVFVSLSGPSANLFLAGALWAVGKSGGPFFSVNLFLGALHLLPIEPLDGGMALKALLCWKLEKRRAEFWALLTSIIFLFPLALLGFFILIYTKYNISLLVLCCYLTLYLFLGKTDLFL